MQWIECEVPPYEGYCSDTECPCAPTRLARGEGYLYISDEVVSFRRDAPGREALQKKLSPRLEAGEYVSMASYEPLIVCEQAARTRNLDLAVAARDARRWWETGKAPLRSTPQEGEGDSVDAEPEPVVDADASEEMEQPDDALFAPDPVTPETPGEDTPSSTVPPEPTIPPQEVSAPQAPESVIWPQNQPAADSPETPPPGIAEPEPSGSDIKAQYAGGPLADFASRMAEDESGNDLDSPPTDSSVHVDVELETRTGTDFALPPGSSPEENRPKQQSKEKSTAPMIVGIVALGALLAGGGGFLAMRLMNPSGPKHTKPVASSPAPERPPSPEPVQAQQAGHDRPAPEQATEPSVETTPPPAPPQPTQQPGLNRAFFERTYAFRDSKYEGRIRFTDLSANAGTYLQQVRLQGEEKVYTVNGTFRYTAETITFRPQSAHTEVVWRLEPDRTTEEVTTFFDPRQADREASRIVLEKL